MAASGDAAGASVATQALRGAALTFTADPFEVGDAAALQHEPDALIVLRDGRIAAFGDAATLLPTLPAGTPVTHHRDALIVPGFIDAHVHYAQLPMIGACGKSLLDWLAHYTYATEQRFADPAFARATAEAFLDECLRQGITTAVTYGTVHAASVDAFFEAAAARGMRAIAGKVLMDRHAPEAVRDTVASGIADSQALIDRWHGRDRLAYAVTPRFAPTSSADQLAAAGELVRAHPGVYVQTHLAETRDEVAWVRELFPEAPGYLDVYAQHGLVGRRSIFGHGLHLAEREWQALHEAGAAIAHCPTSNNFLGSGLFSLTDARRPPRPVRVALGTDVGGGTTLSMLATMGEAYKVARHAGFPLTAGHALWLATAGAADALDLAASVGRLLPGLEADLAVLDLAATPLIAWRMRFCDSVVEALAVLMMLGDDRAIRATYVGGRLAHRRGEAPRGEGGPVR